MGDNGGMGMLDRHIRHTGICQFISGDLIGVFDSEINVTWEDCVAFCEMARYTHVSSWRLVPVTMWLSIETLQVYLPVIDM